MKIHKSSGDVFKDIGFNKREAFNLNLRAQLMIEIEKLMKRKKLTQKEAAKLFGVTQPRISDLSRGKIDLFTIDMLVNMLGKGGMIIDFQIHKQKAA